MSSTAHGTEEHDAFQAQTEAACRKRCCSQIAHYNMQWIKEYKGYKGHVHLIGGFDNIYITLSIPNSVINGRWFPWVEPPSSEAMQMKSKPPQLGHLGQQALPSSEGQRSRWSQCKVHSPRSNNDSLDMSWHVLTCLDSEEKLLEKLLVTVLLVAFCCQNAKHRAATAVLGVIQAWEFNSRCQEPRSSRAEFPAKQNRTTLRLQRNRNSKGVVFFSWICLSCST